ncbi:unnamed protein product [Enterobius vermicularis]|uniref:SAM domain-containing protein n=1 Tax=Enterobius vermicularis TaxID=51028 RepID=A0A0N4UVK2_ENTVE|nr:unnamed protein product [Enterobius vermicularis]
MIKGRVLIDLNDRDLEKIGISNRDERQVLLHEIQKEKLHSYLKELTELSRT